jgi:hypothetical protein
LLELGPNGGIFRIKGRLIRFLITDGHVTKNKLFCVLFIYLNIF